MAGIVALTQCDTSPAQEASKKRPGSIAKDKTKVKKGSLPLPALLKGIVSISVMVG